MAWNSKQRNSILLGNRAGPLTDWRNTVPSRMSGVEVIQAQDNARRWKGDIRRWLES